MPCYRHHPIPIPTSIPVSVPIPIHAREEDRRRAGLRSKSVFQRALFSLNGRSDGWRCSAVWNWSLSAWLQYHSLSACYDIHIYQLLSRTFSLDSVIHLSSPAQAYPTAEGPCCVFLSFTTQSANPSSVQPYSYFHPYPCPRPPCLDQPSALSLKPCKVR
ncbi:hypothetical protein BKA80DRAFT_264343 [Phyllosticta citrichinensis]